MSHLTFFESHLQINLLCVVWSIVKNDSHIFLTIQKTKSVTSVNVFQVFHHQMLFEVLKGTERPLELIVSQKIWGIPVKDN